jgi:hypothetical protein
VAGPAFGSFYAGTGAVVSAPASAMPPPPRPTPFGPIAPCEVYPNPARPPPIPALTWTTSTSMPAIPTLVSMTSTPPPAAGPCVLASAAYREVSNATAATAALVAPSLTSALGAGISGGGEAVHLQGGQQSENDHREAGNKTPATAPSSNLAAPNTTPVKTKKTRARSATPTPPGRSPYNLRGRRGGKAEDANAGPPSDV